MKVLSLVLIPCLISSNISGGFFFQKLYRLWLSIDSAKAHISGAIELAEQFIASSPYDHAYLRLHLPARDAGNLPSKALLTVPNLLHGVQSMIDLVRNTCIQMLSVLRDYDDAFIAASGQDADPRNSMAQMRQLTKLAMQQFPVCVGRELVVRIGRDYDTSTYIRSGSSAALNAVNFVQEATGIRLAPKDAQAAKRLLGRIDVKFGNSPEVAATKIRQLLCFYSREIQKCDPDHILS